MLQYGFRRALREATRGRRNVHLLSEDQRCDLVRQPLRLPLRDGVGLHRVRRPADYQELVVGYLPYNSSQLVEMGACPSEDTVQIHEVNMATAPLEGGGDRHPPRVPDAIIPHAVLLDRDRASQAL